jgi:hypothetical protein
VAYRYGFNGVTRIGHGGYAVVIGHDETPQQRAQRNRPPTRREMRRVLRLVPDHHVQDIRGGAQQRPFDVELDDDNQPRRDPNFPLLLSDVFLMPRHTCKLIFYKTKDSAAQAGGKPAILHCQLLPQVIPMNGDGLNRDMAIRAGELLESALATLGVSVADAHGGNGGVLAGVDGKPLIYQKTMPNGQPIDMYIPVVLDYGYYSEIEPRKLGQILTRNGITVEMMQAFLESNGITTSQQQCLADTDRPLKERFAEIIADSSLKRAHFGRLLYQLDPPIIVPDMWLRYSEEQWQTTQEDNYPPLRDQSRLTTIYPSYDEIVFPQRIEEYHFQLPRQY